jgi:pantoate--beta-alanine ligase
MIEAAGPCEIDYIEIMDADNLQPKQTVEGRCLLAVAVKIGPSRLIDNIVVDAGQAAG